jgi:hypothetical protein
VGETHGKTRREGTALKGRYFNGKTRRERTALKGRDFNNRW